MAENFIEELVSAIKPKADRRNLTHSAVISRVDEEGTVWVYVAGGDRETPVASAAAEVKRGDIVNVEWRNNRLYVAGNYSNPSAGVTRVQFVEREAAQAQNAARTAKEAAVNAVRDAEIANKAAEEAGERAKDADRAAGEAKESAATANTAANNALAGLSTVESVVDVVNWFAEHKEASTDTAVDPGKIYYIYDTATGALTKADPEGTENPAALGWYEISEAIAEYVATHVAETDDGLSVIGAADGWRVLISSGAGNYAAGVYLIDPDGNIAQATTATGITFDDSKPFYVGDEDAFIAFNGSGGMTIGGNGIRIGSEKLSDVLSKLDASLSAVEYAWGSSATSHGDIPASRWSTDAPEWKEGRYIWMRTTTNGMTYTYTCIQGAKGVQGDPGADAILISITASAGTVFKNTQGSTTLTANVFVGGVAATVASNGTVTLNGTTLGVIKWYKGSSTTGTAGNSISVTASEVGGTMTIKAQLEA